MITASVAASGELEKQQKAQNIDIAYCSQVGKYRPNYDRPISVTFQCREDKELLMSTKNKLPIGIYVNHKYPPHMKKNRDRIRPLLKLTKSMLHCKDKSRMEGDKLVIDGKCYSMYNLSSLPQDIPAYLTTEKSNNTHVAFQGELSPYSNFHPCRFTVNEQQFQSSEHWIQYQKSLFLSGSVTANEILKDAYAAKQLSYQI